MERRIRQMGVFLFSILLPLFIGFIGSLATRPAIPTWYAALEKPIFSPPNWLFGPAWTLLYLLMGSAAYLVWQRNPGQREVRTALWWYAAQLALNCAWSFVFFGLRSLLGGMVVILLLWVLIFITMRRFYKISKPAGWLFLPYILWVSFATILNAALLILNR